MSKDEFNARLFNEALKMAEGRGNIAEIFEQDLDKDLRALHQQLVNITGANPAILDKLRWMLAGVVGKAKLVGATGPLSDAMKRATKEPYRVGSSNGGKKAGDGRRLLRSETWEPHAKDLAKKCRDEDPKSSQDDVAHYILNNWAIAKTHRQKHPTFRKLVVRMEKDGSLPRRAK